MVTREENELLTRVGPGTPAGELLRRYWHPVAMAVVRDPNHPIIDTKLAESIRGPEVAGRPIGLAAATTAPPM